MKDVYILSSSVILVLVCIWHSVVAIIEARYGSSAAKTADTVVLIVLGMFYFIKHVAIGLWVGIRVSAVCPPVYALQCLVRKKYCMLHARM